MGTHTKKSPLWLPTTLGFALLLLAACGETKIETGDNSRDGITITATGEAEAVPDLMRANFSATGSAKTSEEALKVANFGADAVRKVLKDAKIPEKDYSTPGLYVNPEYNYTQNGQELIGYRATQAFEVVFRDLEEAGPLIDAIVANGGNAVSVNGTSLEVSDTGKASESARKDAVAKARAKAEAYADLFDVKIGELRYVQETSAPVGPVFDGRVAGAAKESGTTIDPGVTKIQVSIEARWSIED